ncbi:hypothetical protein MF672_018450 [Actinomadura sp. ATCC 31491]|uniref:Uncharacterized protein n=1 Tax=Actinomadura luzonensis TaxID=2805427 RepID=A0ABT0FV23_9ACTN|nr:hypothetical protein [Actinomadura luzonensis]MCK2215758.1 hypothetical protein [Actinomadura luzonensis]
MRRFLLALVVAAVAALLALLVRPGGAGATPITGPEALSARPAASAAEPAGPAPKGPAPRRPPLCIPLPLVPQPLCLQLPRTR